MSTVIVDYGSGNLRSAAKAFERMANGAPVTVSADPVAVAHADRLVLPGVGAFADCKAGLAAIDGMIEAITEAVHTRAVPFLGICVGMQLMADRGLEHGETDGFGWIAGDVVALEPAGAADPHTPGFKIPHMGWNDLAVEAMDHPVLTGLGAAPHVYFVHSYHLACQDPTERLATTQYGGEVTAVVGRDNLIGTQFHPEKSQAAGLKLIENFLGWAP